MQIRKLMSRVKATIDVRRPLFFAKDYITFAVRQKEINDHRFRISVFDIFPCLDEKSSTASFDRHYIYHTAWAARVLSKTKPKCHIDISSNLFFCSIVSAFVPIEFYDYRPAQLSLEGLKAGRGDVTSLPFSSDSVSSLSCMHVIEHIGLGRYGDPIDPSGDIKAVNELKRVLACDGDLLFVVPVGKPRIQYNAHRIYSFCQVMKMFSDLHLVEFSLICDDDIGGPIVSDATEAMANQQRYGCGLFWFRKISRTNKS
jgi:hypothetical protein